MIRKVINELKKYVVGRKNTERIIISVLNLNRLIFALEEQASKTEWIPVSERLPEDFGIYLITLENGDVCKCEFNPDFIDEEHENGAFTYYHQYFDGATLGMIDEEEEAVDAIAWMPYEPYEPQESEGEE